MLIYAAHHDYYSNCYTGIKCPVNPYLARTASN